MFEIEEYQTEEGEKPFSIWLEGLKDTRTQARISARLRKAGRGLLGNYKYLEDGICELKEDFGPGYRIYYSRVGVKILLLLAGSDKSDQAKTIEKAKEYLADYERRQIK